MKQRFLSMCWIPTMILSATGHADAGPPPTAAESTPYINPARDCITEGMINPENKDYRYLYSKDCKVVFVLPPPVMPQNIKNKGLNLRSCGSLASIQHAIDTQAAMIDNVKTYERELEAQLEKAKTPAEEARLTAKMAALQARQKVYEEGLKTLSDSKDSHFGQVPGMMSSITLVGNVGQTELNQIRSLNNANLNRMKDIEIRTTGPDGQPVVTKITTVQQSSLRPAPISSSLFSFTYRVPADAVQNGGIVSTNIPGLEYLAQEGAKTGTISVRANDVTSGEVQLALTLACEHAKPDASGVLQIAETVDPLFTVNRSFKVQEMFAQGYTASLKVDKVVDQITKYATTHTEQGFKKSVVFEPTIKADVSQLLNFQWDTEYDDGKATTLAQIYAIKTAVITKLVDDYIENLVKNKVLEIEGNKNVEPAPGGYVDDTRVANRCWSESNGGLSGLFGGRHAVCGDYTYTVKVWHDGVTTEDLRKKLTLNGSTVERMTIEQVTPFDFSTAFVK